MSKRQRLEEDEDDDTKSLVEPTSSIICSIQPCENTPFLNYSSYESHVLTNHTHNCLQCKKRFPNENLLEIHIEENHNPFFDIKKDKGRKYIDVSRLVARKCQQIEERDDYI